MNQDFRDLLAEVNARSVEFLLVGAHALAAHGHVRATQDLDIFERAPIHNFCNVPWLTATDVQLGAAEVIKPNGAEPLHNYPFKFPVCG